MEYKKHLRRVRDHLWGPAGSLVLHVIIVLLLIKFLVFNSAVPSNEIEVRMSEMEVIEIEQINKVLDDIEVVDDMENIDSPVVDEVPPEPVDADMSTPEFDMPSLEVEIDFDFQGPLVLKGLFAGRSASGRERMLNEYAGKWKRYTEPAVIRALEWLKKNQVGDGDYKGSWGRENDGHLVRTAMAGLGLLAFLAHGETLDSENYGNTVDLAIQYLLKRQEETRRDGAFCALSNQGVYAHGIAAYAMSEAYAMTRIPQLKESMDAAIRTIVEGQQAGGGWDYAYLKGARRDTSVASWQIQALKAAYMAGSNVEGLDQSIRNAAQDLMRVYRNDKSDFLYAHNEGQFSSCSASIGILCLQLAGYGKEDLVLQALRGQEEATCDWETGGYSLYKWYYLTQAKFHAGGETWKRWNNEFAPAYVKQQHKDGHWEAPLKANDRRYGDAFATALGALTLQVYYRFLPTYMPIESQKIETGLEPDEDIKVEII